MTEPDLADTLRELAAELGPERNWAKRPFEWSRAKTRLWPWSAQRAIQESVRDHRYTAVPSAHDLGKSRIAAEIMAWWIDAHPLGEAFVVSTAPSAAQVSAILWREVAKAHRQAGLPGKINRAGYPQWYWGPELIGYGRKPADYEDSAFQGIHAKYVLVVIDEACGVAKSLYDAVDALVTNQYARVLAIGNPDNPGSHFAAVCKPGTAANSGWHVIALDGLYSPNMSRANVIGPDPGHPRYPLTAALIESEGSHWPQEKIPADISPYLLSPLWVEERISRWAGVGAAEAAELSPAALRATVARRCAASSLFTAKVRGVFPPSSTDGVIPLGWVQFAIDRHRRYTDRWTTTDRTDPTATVLDTSHVPNPTRFVLGVDVARGGADETVFAPRYGDYVPRLHRFRIADTTETAAAAAEHLRTEPHAVAVVDVIGIGAGVFDLLRAWYREGTVTAHPVPFVANGANWRTDAIGAFRFFNDRSAAWWRMRELLDPSRGSQLMLPDDERLVEELVCPRWRHMASGVIAVETKDEIRKRLGRSTDSADAVIQAFWVSGRHLAVTGPPSDRWAAYHPATHTGPAAGPAYPRDWHGIGTADLDRHPGHPQPYTPAPPAPGPTAAEVAAVLAGLRAPPGPHGPAPVASAAQFWGLAD